MTTKPRPWEREGVCRKTWYTHRKKAREAAGLPPLPRQVNPMSEAQRRPWLLDGVSKRTYYRNKAKRRAAEAAELSATQQHAADAAEPRSTVEREPAP